MEGVELSARFALPPNSRGYCGKGDFLGRFASYLKNKCAKNGNALEASLKGFAAHYAYLKLIADANGMEPFDSRVAQALWLGNGLLKKVKRKEIQALIRKQFSGPGMLTKNRAEKMASSLPFGFVPHHSFHVLYLHTISGVIAPSVKNADSCRVSWGKVIGTEKGMVKVKTQRLAVKKGILRLVPAVKRWKTSCAGISLLPDARKGDAVASHWGIAVMVLSKRQAAMLERVTLRNIRAANKQ